MNSPYFSQQKKEGLIALLFFVAATSYASLLPNQDLLRTSMFWGWILLSIGISIPLNSINISQVSRGFLMGIFFSALFNAASIWAQWANIEHASFGLFFELKSGRLTGNLRQANHAASLLCLGIVATREMAQHNVLAINLLWPIRVFLLSAVLLTESRTALLILTILLLFEAKNWPPTKRSTQHYARTKIIFVSFLLITSIAWITTQRDSLLQSKTILWSRIVRLILESPWTGHEWGSLSYQNFLIANGPNYPHEIIDNPHNLILSLFYIWGIPAGFLIFFFICKSIALVIKRTPSTYRSWTFPMLFIVTMHSMFEYPLWYGIFQAVFLMVLLPSIQNFKLPFFDFIWCKLGRTLGATLISCWIILFIYQIGLHHLYNGRISTWEWRFVSTVGEGISEKYLIYYRAVTEFSPGNCSRESADLIDHALRDFPEPAIITRWLACAEKWYSSDMRANVLTAFKHQFPEPFIEWQRLQRPKHESGTTTQ